MLHYFRLAYSYSAADAVWIRKCIHPYTFTNSHRDYNHAHRESVLSRWDLVIRTHLEVSLQGILQNESSPLLDIVGLVYHVSFELHDGGHIDRLLEHLRQVLYCMLEISLVILKDMGAVAFFQAIHKR
jgi:hypothetical protein